jgi:hypothetical protein
MMLASSTAGTVGARYPLATSSATASAAETIRWISRTHTPAYSGVTSTLSAGIHGRALTGLYSGSQGLWCPAMAYVSFDCGLDEPIFQGTYAVRVRFEPRPDDAASEPLFVTVKVVVPSADVHAPAKQIIELLDGHGELPPLLLAESSGRSRLSVTGADRLDNFVHDGKTIAPRVELTVPKSPPGSAGTELRVRLEGAFPLGT